LSSARASRRHARWPSTGLVPNWLACVLRDLWNNEQQLRSLDLPLSVVHSRTDELVRVEQAFRLCQAARGARRLVLIDGIADDAPLEPDKPVAFWARRPLPLRHAT
jgi:pimeloyl-ACP methyl ester carboxylesterase